MADDFSWMLGMNKLARQFGDGLKPELEALLVARAPAPGTIPLPVMAASAGPAEQAFTQAELAQADIPQLAHHRLRNAS